MISKFKVGDIINSVICSPQQVIEIRLGMKEDFKDRRLKNGKILPASFCDWTGEPCYALRYIGGKQTTTVCSVVAVDSDHHLKGSAQHEKYEVGRAT